MHARVYVLTMSSCKLYLWKGFEAWVEGVFLQRKRCLLQSRHWVGATSSRITSDSQHGFFIAYLTTEVMWITSAKAGLWLRIFRGDFFFFSLYRFPSLGQVYFWYTIMPAGIGIWGSRFVLEDVWLDNIHLYHLNLDFVSCVLHYLQKQNCKVTQFDTFHKGDSRWSTWHLAGFQAFTLLCCLRISTFLGQRWLLLIQGVF